MKIKHVIPWILAVFVSGIVGESCKKMEPVYVPTGLAVQFPRLNLRHDRYYSIPFEDRSTEMEFNALLDSSTVLGNILFSDHSGSLDSYLDLHVSGRKVLIMLHPDFDLQNGWQYFLTIKTGVRSVSGLNFQTDVQVEFRTTGMHPNLTGTGPNGDTTQRRSLVVISDIHMGDARANELQYCWFGKNNAGLLALLDFIYTGNQVKQVVILGDLFDEWIVPYTLSPFDPQIGITNSKDYFHAVANNPVNQQVVLKLQQIAASNEIELIYVPGNHDMLLTNDILQEIIPGITWRGDTNGLGRHYPVPEIVLEHGHRYDFFNCPQSLVSPGHMLPPGYFISRLYAQGTMEHPGLLKSGEEVAGSFEFLAAWEIAYYYTIVSLRMTLPNANAQNILMGGIDNYSQPFSFNGVRNMYAVNIEDFWPATQTTNRVVVPMPCCLDVIWNGHSDLYSAATTEYMKRPPAPQTYRIVGFGHTHQPLLEVYPQGQSYTSIYANSGSWVDASQSSYPVRTYLIITPGAWSGSPIDVVGLYQYNLESNSGFPGSGFTPVLLAEESIEVN